MIICICYYEKNKILNRKELIVSHGINEYLENVVLPQVHPLELGAEFNEDLGEWILMEFPD